MRSNFIVAAVAAVLAVAVAASAWAQDAGKGKGKTPTAATGKTKGTPDRDAPPAPPPSGSGKYYRLDYAGSDKPGELAGPVSYVLWIPDSATQLRGLIVHQHGAGTTASIEGSTGAYDLHWQALAKKWDCALWSSSYHVENEAVDLTPGGSEHWFDPRRGSEKTFLKALDDFGAKSNHPELAKVPWVLWGHSGGGIWSDVMTDLHPERVVAVWMRSGSAEMFRSRSEFPQPTPPEAAYKVPEMGNPGGKGGRPVQRRAGHVQAVSREGGPGRVRGRPADRPRVRRQPLPGHPVPRRLHGHASAGQGEQGPDLEAGGPEQGLARAAGAEGPAGAVAAVPCAEYKGNPQRSRLAAQRGRGQGVARIRQDRRGERHHAAARPVRREGDARRRGRRITWNADADFESGIRNFIVLRDGAELASVPREARRTSSAARCSSR